MNLNIELKPHVGIENTAAGPQEVEFDQFIIVASGEALTKATKLKSIELGYVGKQPGAPINYLPAANRFGQKVLDEITKVIKQKLGDEEIADRPVDGPLPEEIMNAPEPSEAANDEGSEQNL